MSTVTNPLPSILCNFSRNLLKEVPADQTVWMSPIGIITALGMVFAATSDKEGFKNALDLSGWADRDVEVLLSSSLDRMNHRGKPDLEMTTELHTDGQSPMNPEFIAKIQKIFRTQVLGGADSQTTILRCDNAFKGLWSDPFNVDQSELRPFTLPTGAFKMVPMMEQRCKARYLHQDGFAMLELPYQSDDGKIYSRLYFLPDNPNGLAELEERLDASFLQACLNQASYVEVHMILPKLDLKTEQSLKENLDLLGFPLSAELKDLGDNWHIEKVMHKATLKDDEEGSLATSCTDFEYVFRTIITEQIHQFIADRPFHHMIVARDEWNSPPLVYFCGRVADTTAFSNEFPVQASTVAQSLRDNDEICFRSEPRQFGLSSSYEDDDFYPDPLGQFTPSFFRYDPLQSIANQSNPHNASLIELASTFNKMRGGPFQSHSVDSLAHDLIFWLARKPDDLGVVLSVLADYDLPLLLEKVLAVSDLNSPAAKLALTQSLLKVLNNCYMEMAEILIHFGADPTGFSPP